ncbi:hypothetical protein BP6252_08915 [Coleophoma cylindrospora]|uniref:Uncharacterized protein n=1 Tax=Coleophoma cylindrospora TaxID=1849047 RepID=A0A3D8R0F1_9HELO|nr:hypothetical protein BP6252_08915 [Coleophoma cylindrospora]
MELASIIFALVFPALLIGIAQIAPIADRTLLFAVFCNFCLVISCAGGSILLIATLWKFQYARKSLNQAAYANSQHGYARSGTLNGREQADLPAQVNQQAIERAIITRFSIAFTLLSIFEVCNIIFQTRSLRAATQPVVSREEYFSQSSAIATAALFIPGVSCGIVGWAIWGTTKQFLLATQDTFAFILCFTTWRRCILGGNPRSHDDNGSDANIRIVRLRDAGASNFQRLDRGRDTKEGIVVARDMEMTFFDSSSKERVNEPDIESYPTGHHVVITSSHI